MKVITIAGFGWIPITALALCWAGFAPFPTTPLHVTYTRITYCDSDDGKGCAPGFLNSTNERTFT